MAKETAEQKLLKMMQKTSSAAEASTGGATAPQKFTFAFSMRMLNQILIVGIVICAAGLAYEMRAGLSLLNKEIDFSDEMKTSHVTAAVALPVEKNVKYYLDRVAARNIFRPYDGQAKGAGGQQSLAKRLSKYKLVGVAWLDLPETASIMIEDTANKTTYFLKQGEQLEDVTVKTIYTDRVVFSYENEETIIKL